MTKYIFNQDVNSMALGKSFRKGQVVPYGFLNMDYFIEEGVIAPEKKVVVKPVVKEKPKKTEKPKAKKAEKPVENKVEA